jgi:hypothetical protein
MLRQLRVFLCAGQWENIGAEAFIRTLLLTGHALAVDGGFVVPYLYPVTLHNS